MVFWKVSWDLWLVDHTFRTASLCDNPQMEPAGYITIHSLQSDFQNISLQVWGTGKERGEELNIYQKLAGGAFGNKLTQTHCDRKVFFGGGVLG